MPLFDYQCKAGHVAKDVFHRMNDTDAIFCAVCGKRMEKLPSLFHSDLKEFHTPIVMHSIGCNSIDEIREMQRAGVSISDDPNNPDFGVPVAHSRHEKLKALKVAGFQEKN